MLQTTDVTAGSNQMTGTYSQNLQNVLGKEDFLRLLITQLRYQDPINPMQNEEFIAQLAQFSSLEQMQNMNEKLDASLQSDLLLAQSISNSMITALIGKEATVQTDRIYLPENGEASFGFRVDQDYSSAQVSIYDENGSLVYYEDMGPVSSGETSFKWDGRSSLGNQAIPGSYRVEVKLVNGDNEETNAATYVRGEVTAVKYHEGGSSLVIHGHLYDIANVLEVSG